ncbi:hypothetical protein QD336_00055 [Rhizobium sp. BR 250]
MNERKNDTSRVQEWPTLAENHWYALAITSAILTGLAILTAFFFIFGNGFDGDDDLKMAQALAPFGVALFALVTFCTAGWRGSINTRQANQSESEGRAKLLQEGAKFLAEGGKPAHVSAGIATLGVLVSGGDKDYGFQAMNLLADYIEDHMSSSHSHRHRPQISTVMTKGDENGLNTGRNISFSHESDEQTPDDDEVYWSFIPGFKLVSYYGGVFDYDPNYELDDLYGVEFRNVEISNWRHVHLDHRFYRCRYTNCGIRSVDSLLTLNHGADFAYAFNDCDFSGCEIYDAQLLTKDLKKQRNYYLRQNPPALISGDQPADWEEIFECFDEKPKRDWPF